MITWIDLELTCASSICFHNSLIGKSVSIWICNIFFPFSRHFQGRWISYADTLVIVTGSMTNLKTTEIVR